MKGIDAMFDHGATVGALKEHEYVMRLAREVRGNREPIDYLIARLKRRRKTLTANLDQAARANCPPSPADLISGTEPRR